MLLPVLDPAVRAGEVTAIDPCVLWVCSLIESQDEQRFQWWLARADASVQAVR